MLPTIPPVGEAGLSVEYFNERTKSEDRRKQEGDTFEGMGSWLEMALKPLRKASKDLWTNEAAWSTVIAAALEAMVVAVDDDVTRANSEILGSSKSVSSVDDCPEPGSRVFPLCSWSWALT